MSAVAQLQKFLSNQVSSLYGGLFSNESRSITYIRDPLGNPNTTLSDYVDFETGTSGTRVTNNTALALATVYSCVKIIAEDISTCDLYIEKKKNRYWERDHTHYLNEFFQNPSPYKGLQSIRESYIGNAALTGNGIAGIRRHNRTGRVEEILSRDYTEAYVYETTNKERLWYYVSDTRGNIELLSDSDVLHVKNFSLDGRVGLSPVNYQSQSISVGLNAIDYAQDNFSTGGFGGGFIENPNPMDGPSRLRYAKQVKQAQALGIHPVLDGGIKFVPNKINPKDVDLINTLNWTQQNVASTYRMPLHMLGVDNRASGTNLEQQTISYVTNCIRPWARKEEEELERKLLTTKERKKYRIKVDLSSLMRGDMSATASYMSTLVAARVAVPNEMRKIIGLPPTEWGNDPVDHQKSAIEANGGPSIHTMSNGNHEEE